jgi:hypothetical protein
MPRLDLRVCDAAGLPADDGWGKIDPVCMVSLSSDPKRMWRTDEKDSTGSPQWDQLFRIAVSQEQIEPASGVTVDFSVWDSDIGSDDYLGQCRVPLADVARGGATVSERWMQLQDCKTAAALHVRLRITLDEGDGDASKDLSEPTDDPNVVPTDSAEAGRVARSAPGTFNPPAASTESGQLDARHLLGRTIRLRSVAHPGSHVRATASCGAVDMQPNEPAAWERFGIEPAGPETVLLCAVAHGSYLTAGNGGDVGQRMLTPESPATIADKWVITVVDAAERKIRVAPAASATELALQSSGAELASKVQLGQQSAGADDTVFFAVLV